MSVDETLETRGEIYGDYLGGTSFRTEVMLLIKLRYSEVHGFPMPKIYQTMMFDIVNKLSRLAVTPDHIDTVHDIAGYSKLYEEVLSNAKEQ